MESPFLFLPPLLERRGPPAMAPPLLGSSALSCSGGANLASAPPGTLCDFGQLCFCPCTAPGFLDPMRPTGPSWVQWGENSLLFLEWSDEGGDVAGWIVVLTRRKRVFLIEYKYEVQEGLSAAAF